MVGLAVAVMVTFAGSLWFLAHHKKEDVPVIPYHKANGKGLPPKPEERWKYIKELENRQVTVPTPTEPSAGGEIQSHTQLTDEQRQLLEQMQADMRQSPTQLNEVPWYEQTPAQRQQTQETAKKAAETTSSTQRWMVQCGSFKGTDQAESARAGLAFEGFESRITIGGGRNRVVIGPFKDRSSADSMLKRLRGNGHSNCIPLSVGG
nr:Cell division protein FtsN [Candidatus Pantoea persica]